MASLSRQDSSLLMVNSPSLDRIGEKGVNTNSSSLEETLGSGQQEASEETIGISGDAIRVFVRVRPLSEREQRDGQACVAVDPLASAVHVSGENGRSFAFDGVFGEEATQDEVFEQVGRHVGRCCLAGYNGSVYVYGQTGSGKTYTMCGQLSSVQSLQFDERRGLICRVLDLVFTEIHRRQSGRDQQDQGSEAEGVNYLCRFSALEIYKETITDLLEPSSVNLQIREDLNRGVYVAGLSEHTVGTHAEAFQVFWRGINNRHVGATQMNERSSRSHAVFTLSIEAAQKRAGVTTTRVSALNLVDLAGSERQQGISDPAGTFTTPYESLRVKEAGAINRSLSALTNVIMSLSRAAPTRRKSSQGGERRPYVHYRDSKLTFLLRDSLGGNSKTVVVANISPAPSCVSETLSSLKFASRAKHIRCTAVRNEEFSGTVESLTIEVKALRAQLTTLSGTSSATGLSASRLKLSASEAALGGSLSSLGISSASKASIIGGISTVGDDDETGLAEDYDETQVLYSRKRVRRLEVLLAAALERERHADKKREELHRLAEQLECVDVSKSEFMRGLHDDFAPIAQQLQTLLVASGVGSSASTTNLNHPEEGMTTSELTSKLLGVGHSLANLVAGGRCNNSTANASDPEDANSLAEGSLEAGSIADVPPPSFADWSTAPSTPLASPSATPGGGEAASNNVSSAAVSMRTRPGRKRGTSQSLQRGPTGEGRGVNNSSIAVPATAGPLGTVSSSGGAATQQAFPGGFVDETAFLHEENRRLRQQLKCHPEVARLAAENRTLHARLATINSLLSTSSDAPGLQRHSSVRNCERSVSKGFLGGITQKGSGGAASSRCPAGGLTRNRSLTRSFRSGTVGSGTGSNSARNHLANSSSVPGFDVASRSSSQNSSPTKSATAKSKSTNVARTDAGADEEESIPSVGCLVAPVAPPVTCGMVLRFAEPTEDSGLRTWVYFQKMAKEVEALVRAKDGLTSMVKKLRGASHPGTPTSTGNAGVQLSSPRRGADAVTPPPRRNIFAEKTLSLGGGMGLLRLDAMPTLGEIDMVHSGNGSPGDTSQGPQVVEDLLQHSAEALSLAEAIVDSKASGSPLLPRRAWSPTARIPLSPAGSPSEARAAALLTDSGTAPLEGSSKLREALRRVKQLRGRLDTVNGVYNDAYDQFQRLREEYESRLEECHFFELQCSRLDLHCSQLAEKLKGGGDSIVPSTPSQQNQHLDSSNKNAQSSGGATTPAQLTESNIAASHNNSSGHSMPSAQRRCFSLSSLRDATFWEQRFQELSQLVNVEDSGAAGGGVKQQLIHVQQQGGGGSQQQENVAVPCGAPSLGGSGAGSSGTRPMRLLSADLAAASQPAGATRRRPVPANLFVPPCSTGSLLFSGHGTQVLVHSTSLSSLHSQDGTSSSRETPRSISHTSWDGHPARVSSAPLLLSSSVGDLRSGRTAVGVRRISSASSSSSMASPTISSPLGPRPQQHDAQEALPSSVPMLQFAGLGDVTDLGEVSAVPPGPPMVPMLPMPMSSTLPSRKHPAFDTATFLSLTRQPGDKSAALQYVRQSTNSVLQSPGTPAGTMSASMSSQALRGGISSTPTVNGWRTVVHSASATGGQMAPPSPTRQ